LPNIGGINNEIHYFSRHLVNHPGALALAYQGINYTRQEKILDIGPLHATTETQKRIPLPPILGGVMLAGGIGLLFMGSRKKA
jgi:hypothetical protein